MRTTTPRAYVEQIGKYEPGDPRHTVATMRAHLAIEAVKSYRDGDYARSSKALAGLNRLAGFGEVDTAALAARINSDLRNNPGSSSYREVQSLVGIFGVVSMLVGNIVQLIANGSGDPGVRKAAEWINFITIGTTPPSFTESELRDMRNACSGLMTAKEVVRTVGGTVTAGIAALTFNATGSDRTTANDAVRVINTFVGWLAFAIDTICGNLATAFPEAASCTPAGRRPAQGAVCCEGLVVNSMGYCNPPTAPPTEIELARRAYSAAYAARRLVEQAKYLEQIGVELNDRQRAQLLNDRTTSNELCSASARLIAIAGQTTPQGTRISSAEMERLKGLILGTSGAAPLTGAARLLALLALVQGATNDPTRHTAPICYIIMPPAGGCQSPCSGGGGGSAGIVAFALPAAALAWYMLRK